MAEENAPSQELSEKKKLECLRLQAEIAALKKPIWQQSGFWVALLTIFGLLATQLSGWFDLQQQRIANANLLLEAENKYLLAQKEALVSETTKLDTSRIALNTEIEMLNNRKLDEHDQLHRLTTELAQVRRQIVEEEFVRKALEDQVTNLTKENALLKPVLAQLKGIQQDRDKFEKDVLELRSRLASAHLLTKDIVTQAAELMAADSRKDLKAMVKSTGLWTVLIGRWRGGSDADNARFHLTDFYPPPEEGVATQLIGTNAFKGPEWELSGR